MNNEVSPNNYRGTVVLYKSPAESFTVSSYSFIANSCPNLSYLMISDFTEHIELINNPMIKDISVNKYNSVKTFITDCMFKFEKFKSLKNLTFYGKYSWVRDLPIKVLCMDCDDIIISDMPNLTTIILMEESTVDIYRCPKLRYIRNSKRVNVKLDGLVYINTLT